MARDGWARWRALALATGLAAMAGCAGPAIGPEVPPEVLAVGPYEYPYEGLPVEVDPKGYREFVYKIEPVSGEQEFAVLDEDWAPAGRRLTLDFTPKAHRDWRLIMLFRHPGGETATAAETFSVGLPPWHASAEPVEFQVRARYTCLWSEHLTHMVNVKTLLGFAMELVEVPPGIDRSVYTGFSATVPRLGYTEDGEKRAVPGQGGGRVYSLESPLQFAGNYRLTEKDVTYPRCVELEDTLVIGPEEWETAVVRLIDKYHFPVKATVGRVVESRRVARDELLEVADPLPADAAAQPGAPPAAGAPESAPRASSR